MIVESSEQPVARYLVGIDLGTTNSALAYVDAAEKTWRVRDFAVPQLVAPGQVEGRAVLPSSHYEPAASEVAREMLRLPWNTEAPGYVVGAMASDFGAQSPGRMVVSAKSWLSHRGVDRTAPLLPWHGAEDVERLSPVQVSGRYLAHLAGAWDAGHPEHPLAAQDAVLTVPASFDEVARELTVQAARLAGINSLTLVEEPQAAFYAWIDAQGEKWDRRVQPGQTILVCDVGGGTCDLTLIRARPAEGGKVMFHRVAVGEHLILGGDNLDLALAHHVETKIAGGNPRLDPRRWGELIRQCRKIKEILLSENAPVEMTVHLAGGGSKLIGSGQQVVITRDEVVNVLVDGFMPRVELEAKPITRRSGFQEFGLPFAADAAITRYLAAFLRAHGESGTAARPDWVLFNGGLFASPLFRRRLLEVLASWFGQPPGELHNDRLDLAVARGAAAYGMVRRGRGVRIRGGLAHSYYLGIESASAQPQAVCLVPAGVEEGQTVDLLGRTFELLIRQPAEFPLFSSATRTTDAPGAIIEADPEQLAPLPPIRTVLKSGRKTAADTVPVHLHAKLTEIGTLDIWCSEAGAGDRQWKLAFDVRSAMRPGTAAHGGAAETQGVLDESAVSECRSILRSTFAKNAAGKTDPPPGIIKRIEAALAMSRHDWPTTLLRELWQTLIELESGRRIGIEHEARWLSVTGFCLRPGFGLAVDDWRVAQTWRLFPASVVHAKNESCRAEWWILWRRIAGGLSAGQQVTLAEPLIADWRTWARRGGEARGRSAAFQFGAHESAETWRLLGSLELLRPSLKHELGQLVLDRLLTRKSATPLIDAGLFAVGRFGARVPVYGTLDAMLDAEIAEAWADRLMAATANEERLAFALVQLTRRTSDRYRDVNERARTATIDWLRDHHAAQHLIDLVSEGGSLAAAEQQSAFGESLPRGLRLE
jgi:molecular chaperone DnaK (HSP70)